MSTTEHRYEVEVVWDGNRGEGTTSYTSYGRDYRVVVAGKPELQGSADAAFRGSPARMNPEDLFVSALASCHMLAYLALCAKHGVRVLAYQDAAVALMKEDGRGGGRFEEVVLQPTVTVASEDEADAALRLHDRAHEQCFIASSCSVPVHHRATVRPATGGLA